ncbi:MAG TPA: helicase-related protein [Micropepsaceae bacterium]|nr:helicase-related protein [Micropepsaceae bacterium]
MALKPAAHRPASRQHARITAVLGPTNTGKTHFAIERMLAHRTGMIGLPLRLLAREVFDKLVRLRGESEVALITGEERILPKSPRFYVCTVEAMPVDIGVAFLAVDEIQLCTDVERGHIFTDRLLHARGEEETMWLGSSAMKPAIARIAPETHFITRPRFSELAYTGAKKLSRLPRRSAVVAFSVEDVYGIADTVRTQRGGAAVVLGALSPRTRNAQVALYQSGEVDFMIATDAIGMGINMDVDHVAFAARDKFDGFTMRPLKPEEMGQIAGRAGRYMNDGTFGVTGDTEPLDSDLVQQIENHRYDPVKFLQWRNSALDYSSIGRLLGSLDEPPPWRGLVKSRPVSDLITLQALSQSDEIRAAATAPAAVKLLWQACQLPDFRKLSADEHARLAGRIFGHLISDSGVLPDEWMARQIARLDVVDGDVDTLSGRLAQIRTWTYIANRPGWTTDPREWQELTRAVEDRLSDALHDRLTQRFIDRRTSLLMRHLRDDDQAGAEVDDSGTVRLGDEPLGKLEGFVFTPDPRADAAHQRSLRAAAGRMLGPEFEQRARALINATDHDLMLTYHGNIWWSGAVVAKLAAGAHPLTPVVEVKADEPLGNSLRNAVKTRLETWLTAHIENQLEPLVALKRAAAARTSSWNDGGLPGPARGLAFRMAENLGHVAYDDTPLTSETRAAARHLRRFGVKTGSRAFYLPRMIKPAPSALAAMLWAVKSKLPQLPAPPGPGLTSFAITDADGPPEFLEAACFMVVAGRAVRMDIVDRIDTTLLAASQNRSDASVSLNTVVSLLGSNVESAIAVAAGLGWKQGPPDQSGIAAVIWKPIRVRKRRSRRPPRQDSPFAGLAALASTE